MMLENLDVHMPKKNVETTDIMPVMKINSKTVGMAQWVKACTAKLGDPTWVPGIHMMEGED